jgi:hypothetical protein
MRDFNEKKRMYAMLTAMLGVGTLALQLFLTIGYANANGQTTLHGIVHFISYFAIVANILVTAICAVTGFGPNVRNILTLPETHTAAAVYILIVMLIYALLLRNLWSSTAPQKFADQLLHYAMPALYLIFWVLFVPKSSLRFSDPFIWVVFPTVYLIYALLRGALTGDYSYPFIDARALGPGQVATNTIMLTALFLGVGLAAVVLGRATGSGQEEKR